MYKRKSFYRVIALFIALLFLVGIVELKVENRVEAISLTDK
jgi:hypothetical protein